MKRLKFIGIKDLDRIPQLSEEQKFEIRVVGSVLPFRTNEYVLDELIDWSRVPEDPIYLLTFMQKNMLGEGQFEKMAELIRTGAPQDEITALANRIRFRLNPHPAGQLSHNIPKLDGEDLKGLQHKYRETCLIFPSQGQTCFAYCTFCFRWPQFVGISNLKFAAKETKRSLEYIRRNKNITDILVTGGDPLIMSAKSLNQFLLPLLQPEFEHIQTIRIGSKVLSYWPYRFLSDRDSDDLLRLFEKISESSKHLAFMAHYNHWVEMKPQAAREAVKRVRSTGAEIRSQSPVLRGLNDRASDWAQMWKEQVKLGIIPYYMFVERDTGPKAFFEVPLLDAWSIYQKAIQKVSGLGRTVRGPSMSTFPGKVQVDGVAEIHGEKVFVLKFLQARNKDWVHRPFFAKFDPNATWLTDLKPAFSERFFFEEDEGSRPGLASWKKPEAFTDHSINSFD